MRAPRRRVLLGAALAGAALVAAGTVAPPADAGAGPAPAERVLVLSVPGVAYGDLDLDTLPNLRSLFDESAVADLSVRGVKRRPTLTDGYVTIGAGTRAVGRSASADPACLGAAEPYETGTAAQAAARRTGRPADGAVVCPDQPAVAARNDDLLYDAEVGALGDALAAAGVHRAVIANADPVPPASARSAGLALAGTDAVVPGGTVGRELLVSDPAAAFGVRADAGAYLAAFDEHWRPRSVVLVEAGDFVRHAAYRPAMGPEAARTAFERAARDLDTLVGALMERVGDDDAVLVVGPATLGNPRGLTMAMLRAPGVEPGLLESAYTGRAGVVSIVDVAPTILDLLGVERPDSMEGRPFERTGDGPGDRLAWLVEVEEAARFRDHMVSRVTSVFVVAQIVLVAAAVAACTRLRGLLRAVEVGALALLGFLPATYLAGFVPFHEWGEAAYWLCTVGAGLLLASAAARRRDPVGIDPLLVVLAVLVGVIAVDVLLGAALQFNTALGYSPTIAGRFAGIGNLAYSQLAMGSLLVAGFAAAKLPGRRGRWAAVAVLAAAVVVDGAPRFGADVGGVLSMVPAYVLTGALLFGVRVRPRTVVWAGLAGVVAIAGFAAWDVSRPEADQTHLARFVARSDERGWDAFWTVINRKLAANLDVLFSSWWTVMVPVVLAGVVLLLVRSPGRLRGLRTRVPTLDAVLPGAALLAFLGFALNDSGIAVPAMMLGVLAPAVVVLVARAERDGTPPTGPAPAVRAPADAVARP